MIKKINKGWFKIGHKKFTIKYHYGKYNHKWKGDKVKISGLHQWIERYKGKPKLCEMCGTKKAKIYDWANIDHSYKRILNDFIRLCRNCHRIYDKDKNE